MECVVSEKKEFHLVAEYCAYSTWILDRDLDEAVDYWVKWDTLCVQWEEDGEIQEIDPSYPAYEGEFDTKRPIDVTYYGEQ